ncbi:hypothetical protein [Sphingobacterium litopenaei]|uniref:Uncharacterized protein n=1 Tax=Sphingobacterium litopenaei TaxID=2763500 RepID=A0ABR7YET8_9SPHI|nr:hypothetical protein [Sphingobacterium litopenaei]MBD1429784.1 hypothetical protein [Sphingobacterium litopenaei]
MNLTTPVNNSKILSQLIVNIENAFCQLNFHNNLFKIQRDCLEFLNDNMKDVKSIFIYLIVFNFKNAQIEFLKFIDLSNRIYASLHYALKYNKPGISQSRINYIKILESIDKLIDMLLLYDKKLIEIIPLSNYSYYTIKPKLKQQIISLKDAPGLKDVEPQLIRVVQDSLFSVLQSNSRIRNELRYINILLKKLSKAPELTTESLEWVLFQYGFNSKRYLEYYINKSNQQMLEDSSLHKQIENIISFQEQLYCLVPLQKNCLDLNSPTIIDQILLFFKDKKESLKQKLDVRRTEIMDAKLLEANDKVMFNIPVAQFGLLIKLLMEVNLIPKENVGKTFSFFAKYFKTPSVNFISSESLQKKSSTVEFSTARKMKAYLIEMVNWINKNYNASSFTE